MSVDSPAKWKFGEFDLPVQCLNTLVVGSGAAARSAALQLLRSGLEDVAIVTERWNAGTSYNAGSDKQTYYKLSVAGGYPDSPAELAADLFAGGCMHGDIALSEAQHSAQAFFNLVELGVPFPHDRYGGFAGYRTDNDTKGRATSAGPLTSKLMCERLGAALEREGMRIFDECQVVALLTRSVGEGSEERKSVCGAIALDKTRLNDGDYGLMVFNATNVVIATGGPGGMYRSSVYPQSQLGGTGMALQVGAVAHNLTESQFGIGSVKFRWNLSGSYQQVIPRYISTAPDGTDEREFLNHHFPDLKTLTTAIFRKGYEWPFDSDRVVGHGSSLIDLLVHRETVQRGRRVYLDYQKNPSDPSGCETFDPDVLAPEVCDYLRNSNAMQATPITRLLAMNSPAVDLYRNHGIDLEEEPLEIAVSAQHNNGGLAANVWWESNIRHLFPIGEVCGTHGVRRPGGSALNAGQVGAIRAAQYISHNYDSAPVALEEFGSLVSEQVRRCVDFCARVTENAGNRDRGMLPTVVLARIQDRMSNYAAQIRAFESVRVATDAAWELWQALTEDLRVTGAQGLPLAFRAADLCITHAIFLEAICAYLSAGGGSRGGFMVIDERGVPVAGGIEEDWRFKCSDPESDAERKILEVSYSETGDVNTNWVDVRPVPKSDVWFEQMWGEFRTGEVFSAPGEELRGK